MFGADGLSPLPALFIPKAARTVAVIVDEGGELRLGHRGASDGEGLDLYFMRPLLIVEHKVVILGLGT